MNVTERIVSTDVNVTATNEDTFKQTAVGIEDDLVSAKSGSTNWSLAPALDLPNGYDVVAVRETLLSEAPFVNRGNRSIWRRWMDNDQFVTILKNGYHHILDTISESGCVHIEKLEDIYDSPLIEDISNNFADIYFRLSRPERDVYLPRLPELLLFMIINALQAAVPKHQRMYMSIEFRELLLDWLTEIFTGYRNSSTKAGRGWIFDDCNDMIIMTYKEDNQFISSLTKPLARTTKKNRYKVSSVNSCYHLEHSPLINMYINRNNKSAKIVKNKVTVTLSHFPTRPLITLQDGLVKSLRFRVRRTDDAEVKKTIRKADNLRRTIMNEHGENRKSYNVDMRRLRDGLQTKMKILKGIRISKREEYEANAILAGADTLASSKHKA